MGFQWCQCPFEEEEEEVGKNRKFSFSNGHQTKNKQKTNKKQNKKQQQY
jgi:hypothetical protein